MDSDKAIQLKNIKKQYELGGRTLEVLKGIDIDVKKGEMVAIMGPSGSGKTTLLNMIGCLDVPSSGDYFLAGAQVAGKLEEQLAEIRSVHIGFIFQTFNLIPELTALDNILLPQLYSGKENKDHGLQLLKEVGLEKRMQHKPKELSGGERQRVAIARALINDPSIILADEPTGNLDSRTGKDILNLLIELNKKGRTIILVTHSRKVGDIADRIIWIKDGRVVTEGEL